MKGFNKLNEFKKLKFYSRDRQQILEALDLFEQLGYSLVDEGFNSEEAEDEEGLCVWDDGEITEGWLDNDTFEQVTIEDLKKMVGGVKNNIFTLERLLGCEVKIKYSGVTGYVTDIANNGYFLHICCGSSFDVVGKYHLTFFTEDGDKLTFNEYVKMYYGDRCV